MTDTTRIEELQAEIAAVREEMVPLLAKLDAAEKALLEERLGDLPRHERGTVVLVPRLLFGKKKPWPARIEHVNFYYQAGTYKDGSPWESRSISYAVFLQQKDGEFGGSSEGYEHYEVIGLAPEAGEAEMDALIEALTILRQYASPQFPTDCKHDILFVNVPPALVSPGDLARLEGLHFIPSDDGNGFVSFHFGSC